VSTAAVMAIATVSPRAKELYFRSGELSRRWIDEHQFEVLDALLTMTSRVELAFVTSLITHTLLTAGEEDLMAEFCVALMQLQVDLEEVEEDE
jgi:hypothetical protein